MTEKQYTHHFDGAIIINKKELVAYADNGINARYLCKLLNKQDDRIKELESFIKKIADDNGEIVLLNGYGYNIRKVLHNKINGDVNE